MEQLANQQGWREVLLPWLENKIKNSWPDPREFKNNEGFLYAYNVMRGFAQAANEILDFVKQMQNQASYLRKKEKGEIKDKFREIFRKGGE